MWRRCAELAPNPKTEITHELTLFPLSFFRTFQYGPAAVGPAAYVYGRGARDILRSLPHPAVGCVWRIFHRAWGRLRQGHRVSDGDELEKDDLIITGVPLPPFVRGTAVSDGPGDLKFRDNSLQLLSPSERAKAVFKKPAPTPESEAAKPMLEHVHAIINAKERLEELEDEDCSEERIAAAKAKVDEYNEARKAGADLYRRTDFNLQVYQYLSTTTCSTSTCRRRLL